MRIALETVLRRHKKYTRAALASLLRRRPLFVVRVNRSDHRAMVLNPTTHNRTITLSDVARALGSIPHDAWQRGRSYYWEGVVLSPDSRSAHIRWGS